MLSRFIYYVNLRNVNIRIITHNGTLNYKAQHYGLTNQSHTQSSILSSVNSAVKHKDRNSRMMCVIMFTSDYIT